MVVSQPEIMTITEVADYLKVAERTLYRLAASKKIPGFKIGGAWRFSRAELDDWIKQQTLNNVQGRADTVVTAKERNKKRGNK